MTGDEVAQVVHAHLVPRTDPYDRRDLDGYRPPAADERPLSAGAAALVMSGIPPETLEAYDRQWRGFTAWCEARDLSARPAAQSTMIERIHDWEGRPVHNRCNGKKQANGDECTGHRPAPSTLWQWYSAVRFYHAMPEPPFPWHGGKRLALAMKGYCDAMVGELGWEPNQAPRAWPMHVMAMIDALDLADPKDVRDAAVILTNWYTAGRASDLARYRIGDVAITPTGLAHLTLRKSKTNKEVGKKVEKRVLHPDPLSAKYDAVIAMERWLAWLRDHGIHQGALFRPFTKPGPNSGRPTLLRGGRDAIDYRMASVSMSEIISSRAVEAGLVDGQYFTCHSLRRGRATQLRELGYDQLAIARAHGWAPNGAIIVYMEEADLASAESPTAGGMLG